MNDTVEQSSLIETDNLIEFHSNIGMCLTVNELYQFLLAVKNHSNNHKVEFEAFGDGDTSAKIVNDDFLEQSLNHLFCLMIKTDAHPCFVSLHVPNTKLVKNVLYNKHNYKVFFQVFGKIE